MSTDAATLAGTLAQAKDEDILEALLLVLSLRPGLQGPMSEVVATEPPPRYVGTIARFFSDKSYGFIHCEPVKEQYGFDTFLSEAELRDFAPGNNVSFTVVLNKDGRPQARLLDEVAEEAEEAVEEVVEEEDDSGPMPPSGPPPPPQQEWSRRRPREDNDSWESPAAPPPPKAPRVVPPPSAPVSGEAASGRSPAHDPAARYSGVISDFYQQKHHGFIQSDEVYQLYGVDTYLSSMEKGSLPIGSQVTFRVSLNKSGRPVARDLQSLEEVPPRPPSPARPPPSDEPRRGRPWERPRSRERQERPERGSDGLEKVQRDIQRLKQKVVADSASSEPRPWREGHGQERQERQERHERHDRHDKHERQDKHDRHDRHDRQDKRDSRWNQAELRDQEGSNERYEGVIKSFYPQRRYGFINCDVIMEQYNLDAFLSDREIGKFNNGDHVTFIVRFNKQGQPQAADLRPYK